MSRKRLLVLLSLFLLGGCTWPVREETDRTVLEMASHPFDQAPAAPVEDKPNRPVKSEERGTEEKSGPTSSLLAPHSSLSDEPAADVQTVALMQAAGLPKYELKMPSDLPGSEASEIPRFGKMTEEQKQQKPPS